MSEEGDKLYHTIGEVAQELGVNRSLIRYWEVQFPMVAPRKNRKGERFFTRQDIRKLELIHHLVKERGLTLKGAQKQLREKGDETERNHEALQRLRKLRSELVEWKQSLSNKGKADPDQ